MWELDRPEPVAFLSWDETAWGEPLLAVSPDGRWLVAGPNERLRVWDLADSPAKPTLLSVSGLVGAAFPGGDGRLAVVYRGVIRRRSALVAASLPVGGRSRKPQRPSPLQMPVELVSSVRSLSVSGYRQPVSLSADGRRLAVALRRGEVHVWDVESGKWFGMIPVRKTTGGLACSPDGSKVAVDAGTTVYIYDPVVIGLLAKWKANYSYVPRVAWSPDGRLLARADRSTTARVYETAAGREVASLKAKRGILTCVAFAPDGLTFATGTIDGRVRVWDVG
jgi:WD40 repeat protein